MYLMNKLTQEQRKEQIENLTNFLDFLEIKQPDRNNLKQEVVREFYSIIRYDESKPIEKIIQIDNDPKNILAQLSIKKTVGITTTDQAVKYINSVLKRIKYNHTGSFIEYVRSLRNQPLKNRIVLLKKKINAFQNLDFIKNEITKDLDNFDWIIGYYNTTIEELEQAEKTLEAEVLLDEMGLSETSNLPKHEIFNFNRSENKEGNPDIESEYVYEDDFFFKRIYKPIVDVDVKNLTSVFEIDTEEFESFYDEKLPHFEKQFDATEIDFVKEYIEFFEDFLDAPKYIPNGNEYEEIQKPLSPLFYNYSFSKFMMINKLGERKFTYSTNKKLQFLNKRLKYCLENQVEKNDVSESKRDTNSYVTKNETEFFHIVERFNIDYIPENEISNDKLFNQKLSTKTKEFYDEITENVTKLMQNEKKFYLNRILKRLESIAAFFKYFDEDSSTIKTIQSYISKPKEALGPFHTDEMNDYRVIVNYNRYRIQRYIWDILKIQNDSIESDINEEVKNQQYSPFPDYESLNDLISKEKYIFVLELLENLNISKDGSYILGEKRKGAILGIAEALLENYIVPEIPKTILCKIIAKQINLNIGPKLNTSTTSNKYKKEAINYIKTNYIH
jgi:hypothetical protein